MQIRGHYILSLSSDFWPLAGKVRFSTYAMAGEGGSEIICLNGAAARLALPGDKVIIIAFASLTPEELVDFAPKIVQVDGNNNIC